MKTNQHVSSSKVNKRQCICFYNSEQNQEDQSTKHRTFFENMPMLSRSKSSNIKFKNVEHNNKQLIYQLLNQLYLSNGSPSSLYILLSSKRINPIINNEERDDLQYFIPQIITYMVIEKNLSDQELVSFILKGCITDFYFAHRVYFYLKSLSEDHLGQKISNVQDFINNLFMEKMDIYTKCKLTGVQFTKSMILMDPEFKNKRKFSEEIDLYEKVAFQEVSNLNSAQNLLNTESVLEISLYGTKQYPNPLPINPKTITNVNRKRYCQHGFSQTPKFWQDLIKIGNNISKSPISERDLQLKTQIQKINSSLPANVYIPFFKDQIRLFNILCIWKGILFATKERAPYSIWLEIYREEQEINLQTLEENDEEEHEIIEQTKKQSKKKLLEKIYETLSKPFSVSGQKNTLNFKKFLTEKVSLIDESISSPQKKSVNKSLTKSFTNKQRCSISQMYQEKQVKSQRKSANEIYGDILDGFSQIGKNQQQLLDEYFGKKQSLEIQQRRQRSIYRNLKSWRVIHIMIKTGDDIKQQQFAMQLVNRFQYIFKKQKIDCLVFPYEVISLGPNYGLIEMLNDVSTLNRIFQKLHSNKLSLKDFFNRVFPDPIKAKKNFMRSLAGYSILTYFLQVKDRHNGNILLNREGYIIHIDFGFLLSNAPGKGVQLQKNVPFKLLTQYVEVIGQFDSQQFFEFRRLFYKGFHAILRNKESIIALVKMMYSSHGQSMGCFIKGELAIEELQRRFEISHKVQSFCYDLINSSLDNWRARWYDKFQYFLQKIYY